MKKYINYIICAAVFISLLITSLLVLKHNYVYYVLLDNEIYVSLDEKKYSSNSKTITYEKNNEDISITMDFDDTVVAYNAKNKEILITFNKTILVVKITEDGFSYENASSPEEYAAIAKYVPLLDYKREVDDKINLGVQRFLAILLSVTTSASLLIITKPNLLKKKFYIVLSPLIFLISIGFYLYILIM